MVGYKEKLICVLRLLAVSVALAFRMGFVWKGDDEGGVDSEETADSKRSMTVV